MIEILSFPVVILVFLTSTILLISWERRVSLFSLAVQYFGVFILVSISWPVETAAVKLVAGIMSSAVLGLALYNLPKDMTQQNQ